MFETTNQMNMCGSQPKNMLARVITIQSWRNPMPMSRCLTWRQKPSPIMTWYALMASVTNSNCRLSSISSMSHCIKSSMFERSISGFSDSKNRNNLSSSKVFCKAMVEAISSASQELRLFEVSCLLTHLMTEPCHMKTCDALRTPRRSCIGNHT